VNFSAFGKFFPCIPMLHAKSLKLKVKFAEGANKQLVMHNIFSHLKVVELANVLAGPSVGMFFAELGAEVIKIENKQTNGDITRSWKLPSENQLTKKSAYYHSINYGKTSLSLDLTAETDYNQLLELIKQADIVVANYSDAAALRMRLDYTTLSRQNPRLIYAQLYAFADALDKRPAFDVVLQAEAGFLSMSGTQEQAARMPVALIDILAGHQLKEAILIALLEREKTGKGKFVHTSLMHTAIASLANQASNWLNAGYLPKPMGMLHPNIAPYGDLVTSSDGKPIVLAIGTEAQFIALCKVLGLKELADDMRFSTNTARVKHRTALIEAIGNQIGTQPMERWMELFSQYGIPAGRVLNIEEVFEQNFAKEMVLEQEEDGYTAKCVRTVAFSMNH
jgi:crotonobetainyl-CoA:carnitine CoA-transferase CaiB-like acyl-CoA transferase